MYRRYGSAIVCLLLFAFLFSCEGIGKGPINQAEEFYKSGNMMRARDAAAVMLRKNPKDPDAMVLLWKIQIRNYKSAEGVEKAYNRFRDKVVEIGEPVGPALERALDDDNNFVSLFATYALGDISGEAAGAALKNVLNGTFKGVENKKSDEVKLLQCKAAVVLGKSQTADIYDRLVEMAKSDDAMVRAHAAEALGFLGNKEAVSILEELEKDSDSEVAAAAKEAKAYLMGG